MFETPKQFLNDPDITGVIFSYLGMEGFDVKEIERKLKETKHSIMAGGCVANTLLNIQEGSPKYPVNDIDIFVLSSKSLNNTLDAWQSKPDVSTEEYLQIASPKLYMTGRDVDGELDIVEMSLDNRYIWDDDTIEKVNFPQYVINSFDLNCVEVGVLWSGKSFKLIWNNEFEKFLETRKVEITNIHSMVTLPRAVKKATDLNCIIDLKEEFEIVWYGCNSRNLKSMTTEQIAKHTVYLTGRVNEYLAVLKYSQPLHDEVYQSFFESKLMGNRRDKIKLLRFFRNEKHAFFCDSWVFSQQEVMYLSSFYYGDLKDFFGFSGNTFIRRYTIDARDVKVVEKFLRKTNLHWLLRGMKLIQCVELVRQFYATLKVPTGSDEFFKLVHTLGVLPYYLTVEELIESRTNIALLTDINYLESIIDNNYYRFADDDEDDIPF